MVNKQANHHIIGKAIFIIGAVQVLLKTACFTVPINKPAAVGTYPDIAQPIFGKIIYIAKRQTVRIAEVVGIPSKFDNAWMIIAEPSFVSTAPYNARIIPVNAGYAILAYGFVIIL